MLPPSRAPLWNIRRPPPTIREAWRAGPGHRRPCAPKPCKPGSQRTRSAVGYMSTVARPGALWSISPQGKLQRSEDGGKNWQEVGVDDKVEFRVIQANGRDIWAGGTGGALVSLERWGRGLDPSQPGFRRRSHHGSHRLDQLLLIRPSTDHRQNRLRDAVGIRRRRPALENGEP